MECSIRKAVKRVKQLTRCVNYYGNLKKICENVRCFVINNATIPGLDCKTV